MEMCVMSSLGWIKSCPSSNRYHKHDHRKYTFWEQYILNEVLLVFLQCTWFKANPCPGSNVSEEKQAKVILKSTDLL